MAGAALATLASGRDPAGGFSHSALKSPFLVGFRPRRCCGGGARGPKSRRPLVRIAAEVSTVVRKPRGGLFRKPSMIVDAITVEKGKYGYEIESCINALSQLPPRGSVTRCMEHYRGRLTIGDLAAIFREFASRGDWHRALRLFKYMQRQQWCKPTEHIYTLMIGIMGREGLLDKCAEIFEDMPANDVAWNVYAFTALINAYGRNGQFEASLQLLARMKKERVEPNLITYNTVLNACARGGLHWPGLLNLFAQMRHEGIQPDLLTYNTLLAACAARGLADEAAMVFKAMGESGTPPDAATFGSLVEACKGGGALPRVGALLLGMEHAEVAGYNALVSAHAAAGDVAGAAAALRQMRAAGCAPDVETYAALLRVYGGAGRFADVRALFAEMKALPTPPGVETYDALVQLFGDAGFFPESVRLFRDMVDAGVAPTDSTYAKLLTVCGRAGMTKEAAEIHQHMLARKGGGLPEAASVGLISAYGKVAMYREALVAYYRIREEDGIATPAASAYDALVRGYAKGGLYVEAGCVLYAMATAGVAPPASTYNAVMEAYSRAGLHDEALKHYGDMRDGGEVVADESTHSTLLGVYCAVGSIDEALAEFAIVKEARKVPEARDYCLLLSLCARRGKWDTATRLLDEMTIAGGLHQVVVGILRGSFDADFGWQVVEHAFDGLRLWDLEESLAFYNALLDLLVYCNQKARAARVLADAMQRGAFPEAFVKTRRVWSVNVHRMSAGATVTVLSTWFDELQKCEKLPLMTSIVVSCGDIEDYRKVADLPGAKLVLSFLQHYKAPFETATWNEGRLLCKGEALRPWLSSMPSFAKTYLQNEPLPPQLTKSSSKSKT